MTGLPRTRRLAAFVVLGVLVAAWSGCDARTEATTPVTVHLWAHDGTPAERSTLAGQVRRFNRAHADVRVKIRTIVEGDYNDVLQAAAAGSSLPDVVEVDGPQLSSYVYQDQLWPLDGLLPASTWARQLPSLRAQNTVGGRTFAASTFDSAMGLYADRSQLEAAGVRWPRSADEAWTAADVTSALQRLSALDPDGHVLDVKLNYGPGEWMTFGFAPLVASAGGALVDRRSLMAHGQLDGAPVRRVLRLIRSWSSYVDPNPADDAFTSRRVALSWAGHWVYPDYAKALGDDLLLLPLPDLGDGSKTGQGSYTWSISARTQHPHEAATFLRYLMRDREVLRMSEANGAVPGTLAAVERSRLYGPDGPLRSLAEPLLHRCRLDRDPASCTAVPRPVTPGYPMVTSQFSRLVAAAWNGEDATSQVDEAASVVDEDVLANRGYR